MDTPKYENHPAASIFPLMTGAAFSELVDDIKKHGQREAIVLFRDQILDGRNRERACRKAGVEPEYFEIEECDDPVAWVLSHNLHRRHLTKSQRARIAVKVMKYHRAAAAKRMKKGKAPDPKENLPEGQSRDLAAAALGVSGRMVDMAAKVIAEGTPELIAQVDAGTKTVNAAISEIKAGPCPKGGNHEWDKEGACKKCHEPKPKKKAKPKPEPEPEVEQQPADEPAPRERKPKKSELLTPENLAAEVPKLYEVVIVTFNVGFIFHIPIALLADEQKATELANYVVEFPTTAMGDWLLLNDPNISVMCSKLYRWNSTTEREELDRFGKYKDEV